MKRCRSAASGVRPSLRIRRASSITIASVAAGFAASAGDSVLSSGGSRAALDGVQDFVEQGGKRCQRHGRYRLEGDARARG